MRYFGQIIGRAFGAMLISGAVASAQVGALPERGEEAFASENAILDTAIPFAIGAREARQALRGAFGWPSFQEGLVEGVYFRFDPDGYARFAPTPRLDVDVFEVICRPRTYACAARKDGFEAFLTDRGQLQIRLENALAGDQFFVSEGVSEIQVPERVLQPLDVPLELILGAGGELVVRRGGSEVSRISLKGFAAVTAYLRWIAARQDYAVLPRGWPVPTAQGGDSAATMTQPTAWNSPMPQPQVLAPGYAMSLAAGIAPATTASPVTLPVATAASVQVQNGQHDGVSGQELRAELETLKQIILQAQLGQAETSAAPMGVAPTVYHTVGAEPETPLPGPEPRLAHILAALEGLQAQLDALQGVSPIASGGAMESEQVGVSAPQPQQVATGPEHIDGELQKLQYLISELGLDPQSALDVLQRAKRDGPDAPHSDRTEPLSEIALPRSAQNVPPQVSSQVAEPVLYQNELVDQILAELEAEMAETSNAPLPAEETQPTIAVTDYVLLSRYFKSAALPVLEAMAVEEEAKP